MRKFKLQKSTRDEDDDLIKFQKGIFNLETIRFGRLPEIMLSKLYTYNFSGVKEYDLIDVATQKKIEVKFSCVRKKEIEPITPENILETCLKSADGNEDRKVHSSDLQEFDCNIQQIKPDQFDVLYYGLFFSEKIYIFKVDCEWIKENYSVIFLKKNSDYFKYGTDIKSLLDECLSKQASSSSGFSQADKNFIRRRLGISTDKSNKKNVLDLLQKANDEIEIVSKIEVPNGNYKILDFSNDKKYISELVSICQEEIEIEKILSILNEYRDGSGFYLFYKLIPNLSDKQHKGNDGEGQMHITNSNFIWHKEASGFLEREMTYEDLYKLLKDGGN
ncbi:hypothetical protein [Streptococcus fryi]